MRQSSLSLDQILRFRVTGFFDDAGHRPPIATGDGRRRATFKQYLDHGKPSCSLFGVVVCQTLESVVHMISGGAIGAIQQQGDRRRLTIVNGPLQGCRPRGFRIVVVGISSSIELTMA